MHIYAEVCAPRRAATLSISTSTPLPLLSSSSPRTTESESEQLAAPHLSDLWSLVPDVSRGGVRRLMATGVWELGGASVRRSSVAARCLYLYGTRPPLTPRSAFCCAADDGLRVARGLAPVTVARGGRIADASRAAGAPARFALYRRWRGACYIQYLSYLHQPLRCYLVSP